MGEHSAEIDAPICSCGHALSAHDDSGKCQEWWRYPAVLADRECGCLRPWFSVIPPASSAQPDEETS